MNYDLVVIGAGPGGYVAAIRAAQLGMKTAIVEKDACGGTCLNYGCIPTKALNAEVVDEIMHADEFGISVKGYDIDMKKVQARKAKVVKTLSGGVEFLLKANKVELVKGAAKILAPGKVEVNGKVLETKNILIASGSKASKPPIKGIDNPGVLTSKEALEMDHVPGKIVIIGGGVIGIEFAGIYKAFGAEVTIVEFMPKIIPNMDKEITDRLQKLLEKKGIQFMVGTKVEEISKSGSGLSVTVDKDGKIDFADKAVTENTRVSYPIDHIEKIVRPKSKGPDAKNVIFLSADAFGVLPPVSILTPEQTQYYFLSGFTSKLAGTERGITEPTPTFSACFGQAFLELHPTKYGEELVKKMQKSGAKAYLVNTGWNGTGRRISIKDTRGIIDAILDGSILTAPTKTIPYFNFEVPTALPGVDPAILDPRDTYPDAGEWDTKAKDLASRFVKNFSKYAANEAGKALVAAGPKAE